MSDFQSEGACPIQVICSNFCRCGSVAERVLAKDQTGVQFSVPAYKFMKTYKHKEDFKRRFGVSVSSVHHRLHRILICKLLKQLKKFNCYRCKLSLSEEDFTIDHKVPWAYAKNGLELFLDYKNIAFSHFSCNARHARSHTPNNRKAHLKRRKVRKSNETWCSREQKFRLTSNFGKDRSNRTGYQSMCNSCRSTSRSK